MAEPGDYQAEEALATLVVLTAGRSGSNYLQQLMLGNGFGDPNEYFNPDFGFAEAAEASCSTEEFLARLKKERAGGGVFGVKIMPAHLELMAANMAQGDFEFQSDLLVSLLPNASFLWLRRSNRIRQAISSWRALQTGEYWRWERNEVEAVEPPDLDPDEVDEHLEYLLWTDETWGAFFTRWNIDPLLLIYEEMITDPKRELSRVIEFLEIPAPMEIEARVPITRQADELTDQMVAAYLEARPEQRKYQSLETSASEEA